MSTSDVYRATKEVVGAWMRLGLNLGIPHSTLETIDINFPKVEEKKKELIQTWMTGESMPTWSLLAEALRSPSSDHPRLVERIFQQKSKVTCKANLIIKIIYCTSS